MSGKKYPHPVKRGSVVIKVYRKKERGEIRFAFAHYEDGRRKFRTFALEKDALDEAGKIADRLARADHEGAKFTGADRAAMAGAEAKLADCGTSILEAATTYAAAFKILGGNRILEAARFLAAHSSEGKPEMTVAEAVELFKEAKGKMSKRYRDDIRLMLTGLKDAFDCRLVAVTPDQIEAYLNAKKFGPVARNNHLRVIKAFFNHARARKWLSRALPTPADAVALEKVAAEKVKIFTPAEVEKLLQAADEAFVPWLALVAFGGIRHDELSRDEEPGRIRLRWEHIDFTQGVIHVPAEVAKTKHWRDIPMQKNLLAWLAPFRGSTGSVFAPNPREYIGRASAAAGVPWVTNALRHSFGSYRFAVLKDLGRVSEEMGNSPKMVRDHYRTRVKDKAETKAYWNIKPAAPGNVLQMPKGRRAA